MPLGKRILAILAGLLALSAVAPAIAYHEDGDHPFGNTRFEDRRDRTERPVIAGKVDRSWIWGPKPYTEAMTEPYVDSPNGERLVQYFDKARMEINDPDAEGLWSVTNGLLVIEMVEGKLQVGNNEFDHSPDPARMPIAGDLNDGQGPTYADIGSFGLRDVNPRNEGEVIDDHLTMTAVESADKYAKYGVTAAAHIEKTDHTVAEPFWKFMHAEGLVYENGKYLVDDLFGNPFYATGYPITEAYWTTTPVGGESQNVLWQCFERRCLTYTPGNPEGWKVEAGNVGQHYYKWRYEDDEGATESAQVYLVNTENPDAGIPYEIPGESLVGVETNVPADSDVATRIELTAEELFTLEHPELYNEWAASGSNPSVEGVSIESGLATIKLSGEVTLSGTLSGPRMEAQLAQTAMQFDQVDDVVVLLNGGPLEEPASTPNRGVVAVFDVSGEQFRFWTTNEDTIADLYALREGESQASIPNGPIARGPSAGDQPPYNTPWGWHLDPQETEMAEVTTEVCDATPSFVEANIDYFVDDVGRYCPWNAELVEIRDYRS